MKKKKLLYTLFLCLFVSVSNVFAQDCQPPSNFEANHEVGTMIDLNWEQVPNAISYDLEITNSNNDVLDFFIIDNSINNFELDFNNYNQSITVTIRSNCENGSRSEGLILRIATIESVIRDGNFCNSNRKGKIIDQKGGIFSVYNYDCVCQVIDSLKNLYDCSDGFVNVSSASCSNATPWNNILSSSTKSYSKFYGSSLTSFLGAYYDTNKLANLLCNQGCKIGCIPSNTARETNEENPFELADSKIVVVNPVGNQLNIKFNFDKPIQASIKLINLSGQVNAVLDSDQQITTGNQIQTYNLNDLNAGIYVLYIATESEVFTYKILKE